MVRTAFHLLGVVAVAALISLVLPGTAPAQTTLNQTHLCPDGTSIAAELL
jgi:hypothetical protein